VSRLLLTSFFISVIGTLSVCIGQEGHYVPPKVPEKVCKNLDMAVLAADAGQTESSIEQIQALINKYPTWTNPRHSLSKIYYTLGRKKDAIEILEASIAIDTASQLQQLYTLGRIYEETGQFDKALPTYKLVINYPGVNEKLLEKTMASYGKLEKKMSTFKSDYTITLTPLPQGINTKDQEALGRWTVDGRSVIFTRKIGQEEDLYAGYLQEGNIVSRVEEFAFESPYSEGAHTISPDGKYLIFTSCMRPDGMGSCDLYLSVLKNGKWTEPENMGPGFNSSSWDSQPVFGLDGTSIYFASARPGGKGGTDIWMTYEMSLGKWSKPINLGPEINTANNESSPFIHFDGRTMYFMRDGESGLGGYDLYFARQGIDGKWQSATNMGSPINSGADEGALALHPDGRRAMITRFNEEGKEDLFEFVLPEEFQSTPVQALYVNVIDKETRRPVHARLEIFDINNGDTIRISQWADEKGDITVTLDRNKSYGMIATAENYIMHSSYLVEDSSSARRINIEMVALTKAVDKPIALNNIFFETGSAKLLPSSNPELNKLVWTLRGNENMRIEIRGHTDDVGMDDYNQLLSEERAKSVYQYLIDRGIEPSRLSFKGFGETQPVATNENEEGRRMNRRTEFVIGRFD
jgi:outer membrane protein OmpA-like peptidoglycan-associated protein/Tol biopolymer transport system component